MNDGMNCNMNQNVCRNTNCNMNRNNRDNTCCNMNRNDNCGMSRNTESRNCNMNRNMGNANCNMNRGNCGMNRNMGNTCNNREMNSQYRKSCGSVGTTNVNCGCRMDGCDIGTEHVDKMAPGMSYVPWQKWEDIYCMEKALERGTIFEQLDKPFMGGRGR